MQRIEFIQLCETLEVNHDYTKKELKEAYRTLSLKHHPDKGGNKEVFLKVNDAYEKLDKIDSDTMRVMPLNGDDVFQQTRGVSQAFTINASIAFMYNGAIGSLPLDFNVGQARYQFDLKVSIDRHLKHRTVVTKHKIKFDIEYDVIPQAQSVDNIDVTTNDLDVHITYKFTRKDIGYHVKAQVMRNIHVDFKVPQDLMEVIPIKIMEGEGLIDNTRKYDRVGNLHINVQFIDYQRQTKISSKVRDFIKTIFKLGLLTIFLILWFYPHK